MTSRRATPGKRGAVRSLDQFKSKGIDLTFDIQVQYINARPEIITFSRMTQGLPDRFDGVQNVLPVCIQQVVSCFRDEREQGIG